MKIGVKFSSNAEPQDTTSSSKPDQASFGTGDSGLHKLKTVRRLLSRPIGIIFALLLLASVFGGGLFLKNKLNESNGINETPPVVTVAIAQAHYVAIKHTLEVTGSVSAWDPLSIGSELNGLKIDSVNVEEGDRVHKGDVLATLNSSVLKAQLEQAKARLLSSRTNLRKAIQPNRNEDIESLKAALSQARANTAQQEAMLTQAEANLSNAERNEKRFADLVSQGAVSQADYDTRLTTARTAKAEVNHMKESVSAANFAWQQARERLSMALVGGRKEDIDISKATVSENQATVQQLEAQIQQTVIKAPSDALVIKRDAHIGDITSAGKTLFTLMRDNRLELRAQVPEADLQKIRPGQPVILRSYTDHEPPITGRVREISPMVDNDTRLGTVRIDVPSESSVKPGMFLRGIVDLGSQQALAVPSSAVFNRDGQVFVFTLQGKQARRRIVQSGAIAENSVEITAGLTAGEPVIINGGGFLKDGDYVRVSQ